MTKALAGYFLNIVLKPQTPRLVLALATVADALVSEILQRYRNHFRQRDNAVQVC